MFCETRNKPDMRNPGQPHCSRHDLVSRSRPLHEHCGREPLPLQRALPDQRTFELPALCLRHCTGCTQNSSALCLSGICSASRKLAAGTRAGFEPPSARRLLYERPQLRRRGYVLLAALTRLRNDAHAARVVLEGSGRAWANLCREGVFKTTLDVRGHVVLAVDYDNVLQPTGHAQLSLSDLAQVARIEPHPRLAGQHIAERRLRKFRLAPVAACC
eukprot:scaffold33196_cov73-Phaeocystis_antarctica.AAC.5